MKNNIMNIMLQILIIFFIIIFLIFLFIKYYEKKLIFHPFKELETNPSSIGLKYEDIYLVTKDKVKIHGWFIPINSNSKTILFFHGNAGNISHRIDIIEMLSKLGMNVFIIDYRGYGKSKGKPSEKGIYIDALSSYEYLINQKKINPDDIIVYGKSIGTTAAVDLSSKVNISKLIVDSGLTSAKEMSKIIMPYVPAGLFLSVKFDSINKIEKINCPKLIIHSVDDEIIPFSMGQKLFKKAGQPKQFYESTGGHNDFLYLNKNKISKTLEKFINE